MRIATALLAASVLLTPAPAPASKKPCRDAQGRIVPCPKPSPSPAQRCKDAKGRFVKCGTPGATPAR